MLFLDRIFENCRHFAHKPAIEFRDHDGTTTVTYGRLGSAVEKTAVWLDQLGVRRGDRVAVRLPKSLASIYIHLATCRLGAISMPLNPAYSAAELIYFLNDSGAKLLLVDDSEPLDLGPVVREAVSLQRTVSIDSVPFDTFIETVEGSPPQVEISPDLTALMLYTSGTTGRPKAAELSHANLTAIISSLDQAWGWRSDDVMLHVLPIFHAHGLVMGLHGALNVGATTVAYRKFDANQTLAAIQDGRCSVFMGVPTVHTRLLEAAGSEIIDLSRLRLMTSGSARLAEDLFESFRERFGYELVERYGMTETGILLSNPLAGERRPGWVGVALPGVEVRVANPENNQPLPDNEIGEIQTQGPHVFKGYWNDPQKTASAFTPDGWFKTGDIGLRDSAGYYQLRGRSAELIISGGLNVYPLEVERVLDRHPAVVESAVVGCADAEWGELVTAVVVTIDGPPTEDDLIEYCRESLAPYKLPKRISLVKELPRNSMGKVDKASLRPTCEAAETDPSGGGHLK